MVDAVGKLSTIRPHRPRDPRRGGRVADCTGLENRRTARYRGFESPLLRLFCPPPRKPLKNSGLRGGFSLSQSIGTFNGTIRRVGSIVRLICKRRLFLPGLTSISVKIRPLPLDHPVSYPARQSLFVPFVVASLRFADVGKQRRFLNLCAPPTPLSQPRLRQKQTPAR